MNRMICANGHFYDADKYAKCPHCEDGLAPAKKGYFDIQETAEAASEKKSRSGLFGKFLKKDTEDIAKANDDDERTQRLATVAEEDEATCRLNDSVSMKPKTGNTVSQTAGRAAAPSRSVEYDPMAVGNNTNRAEAAASPISAPQFESAREVQSAEVISQSYAEPKHVAPMPVQQTPPPAPQMPVATPVYSAPAGNDNAGGSLQSELLRAVEARKHGEDDGKTMSFFSGATEPPVGYLVCIKGEDFGTGFLLKSGNNSIGRSHSMDVVLMDPKVSRDRQAIVMYEPRKREFYIRPGESSGLTYYNDDIVMAPQKIEAYGKLSFGDTDLLLVPVCCDKFSWDDVSR